MVTFMEVVKHHTGRYPVKTYDSFIETFMEVYKKHTGRYPVKTISSLFTCFEEIISFYEALLWKCY